MINKDKNRIQHKKRDQSNNLKKLIKDSTRVYNRVPKSSNSFVTNIDIISNGEFLQSSSPV